MERLCHVAVTVLIWFDYIVADYILGSSFPSRKSDRKRKKSYVAISGLSVGLLVSPVGMTYENPIPIAFVSNS
uniref:Aa_trans domain-containing protein n=1 Tax=Angiostrongylus cantonensis TaxID=6313 RepID=A0A0K0DDJ0_ANGCA